MNADATVVRTDVAGHEPELRELLHEYFLEANEQGRQWFDDEEFGADPEEIVAADLDRLASATIAEPLFLARRGGELVGSIQLKQLDETTAEVKRLYVRPSHRETGVGQALVETLISEARADGFETLRLGVAPYHEGARSLYRNLDFEFTAAYEETQAPAAIRDDWGFMKRSLAE
ncbi:GNAT family N-acetyltransferase [Haloprofundus salinisoli]|uniref:GNAT family N-acetyltransferase n=1 Tax=Haloprofundus salinisoli TaxID=2876193 RepID=UPI001CCA6A68|nr:GNAT family N-acetyltransferase [Haloprofundus salinisoli]